MRRLVLVGAFLFAAGVAVFYWTRIGPPAGRTGPLSGAVSVGVSSKTASLTSPRPEGGTAGGPARPAASLPSLAADFPIAARLNAPDSTIARDLGIVQQLFEAWQSNFPRDGNPVGENAEITAALTGENRLGLALMPKDHRALNDKGELCDRWGTPFRFHQLSGAKMEVRSAGPDRRFATDDDAVWTPE